MLVFLFPVFFGIFTLIGAMYCGWRRCMSVMSLSTFLVGCVGGLLLTALMTPTLASWAHSDGGLFWILFPLLSPGVGALALEASLATFLRKIPPTDAGIGISPQPGESVAEP